MFRAMRSGLLLLIVAILLAGCIRSNPLPRKVGAEEGNVAPEIDGVDASGKPLKLSEFRGKVVMLDFWATWCRPCMELVPHERALVAEHKDDPFVLLGVSGDYEIWDIRKVEKNGKVTWRNWWFEGRERNEVLATWKVYALPTILLIDHNGVIQQRWEGNPGENKITAEVNRLIQQAKQYARSEP